MRNLKNLKKTIHLIYPYNLEKKKNPWSIGNNIWYALSDKFHIKNYNWMSLKKIEPIEGDILIGHAHSNPYTIFRRSLENTKWSKKILIQPYNEDPLQMSHLYNIIPKCDYFLAICGKFWFDRIKNSKFKSWQKKMIQLDLGINQKDYPFIKSKFGKNFKRKLIYIGNDYSYNNFAKNLHYLKKIIDRSKNNNFSSAGNKQVSQEKHYGWLDFANKNALKIIKNYDFLIQVSKNDANPSIVLEAISWGLIPLVTKGCGYEELNKKLIISQDNYIEVIKKIDFFQKKDEKYLKKIQKENLNLLTKNFSWKKFQKKIRSIILEKNNKNNKNKFFYKSKEINYFIKNTKASPNYYLNFDIFFSVIKSNIREFFSIFKK